MADNLPLARSRQQQQQQQQQQQSLQQSPRCRMCRKQHRGLICPNPLPNTAMAAQYYHAWQLIARESTARLLLTKANFEIQPTQQTPACAAHTQTLTSGGAKLDHSIIKNRLLVPMCEHCVNWRLSQHLQLFGPPNPAQPPLWVPGPIDTCVCAAKILSDPKCCWCVLDTMETLKQWYINSASRNNTFLSTGFDITLACQCGKLPMMLPETFRRCLACDGIVQMPVHALDGVTHLAAPVCGLSEFVGENNVPGSMGTNGPCEARHLIELVGTSLSKAKAEMVARAGMSTSGASSEWQRSMSQSQTPASPNGISPLVRREGEYATGLGPSGYESSSAMSASRKTRTSPNGVSPLAKRPGQFATGLGISGHEISHGQGGSRWSREGQDSVGEQETKDTWSPR